MKTKSFAFMAVFVMLAAGTAIVNGYSEDSDATMTVNKTYNVSSGNDIFWLSCGETVIINYTYGNIDPYSDPFLLLEHGSTNRYASTQYYSMTESVNGASATAVFTNTSLPYGSYDLYCAGMNSEVEAEDTERVCTIYSVGPVSYTDLTARNTVSVTDFITHGTKAGYTVSVGTRVDLSGVFDEIESLPVETVVTDFGNAGEFGIQTDSNYHNDSIASKAGIFTLRINETNEYEGHSEDYVVSIRIVNTSVIHTVNYSANGGSGSMSPTVVTDTNSGSSQVTLASCGFTKSGYHFVGWKVGNTIYQPGQTISVNGNASVTATAQWEQNTLTLGSVAKQYAVAGKSVSFNASATSNPSGATITFAKSNASSGLNVYISGNVVTCSAANAGTYTFTLTASATGYTSTSTTVTVQVVPVLAFTNSPTAGALNA